MTLPVPMLFIPCDRVIIDSITGAITITNVYETIQPFPFNPEGEIPSNVTIENVELFRQATFVIPPFSTITVWNRGDTNNNDVFEQIVTMTSPLGREAIIAGPVQFSFGEALGHRVLLVTNPLTGKTSGKSILSAKIRRIADQEWQTIMTFPLHIQEIPKVPDPPAQPTQEG